MENEQRTSILQMARGAIEERVDYEMAKVIDNILDPNTQATAKRKLTLTLEFQPDAGRQTVLLRCTAKSALCATDPVSTSLFITDDGSDVTAVEMVPNIPGQVNMYGEVQEAPAVLRILRNA